MAKKKRGKRRRTFSEKVIIVLGIIIALSMILSLVFGLRGSGTGSDGSSSVLPEESGKTVVLETGANGYEPFRISSHAATGPPAPV